jgi:hypothetical protein
MASPIQQGDEVRFRGDFHERIFQLLETVDGYRNFLEAAHLGCCGLGRVYRGGDVPKWRNNSGTAKGRQKPDGGQGGSKKMGKCYAFRACYASRACYVPPPPANRPRFIDDDVTPPVQAP